LPPLKNQEGQIKGAGAGAGRFLDQAGHTPAHG
jgi:hypothetical protein